MDLNIKIIEGVKQFPSLYNNNDNLEERSRAWMQLAEKFKMHEQFLKIRWHSLLQRYQGDANFKYTNRMDFICRKTERVDMENWPEFIITEDYLKDDNHEEQEQFVILDTDEEKINSKSPNSSKETECSLIETPKPIEQIHNKEIEPKDQAKPETGKEIETANVPSTPYETQSDNIVIISSPKLKECFTSGNTTSNVEEKIKAVDVNKNNETTCIQNTKEVLHEKSQHLIQERCEDVIFGELVSAMLKRMDESKKKNMKREIMNILFS